MFKDANCFVSVIEAMNHDVVRMQRSERLIGTKLTGSAFGNDVMKVRLIIRYQGLNSFVEFLEIFCDKKSRTKDLIGIFKNHSSAVGSLVKL